MSNQKPKNVAELLDYLDLLRSQLTGLPSIRVQKISELCDDFREWSKDLLKDELEILRFNIDLETTLRHDTTELEKRYTDLLRERKLNRICKK